MTVPPYEGRQESGDINSESDSTKDGAKVGGATGPVEDDEMKASDPSDTPRGSTGSPSDEQPASEMSERDLDDDATGPAHEPGTDRGENKP